VREGKLQIQQGVDGIIIPVRVAPRSSKTIIDGVYQGALRVRLTSPPVENAANKALISFLARKLKIPKSAVQIVGGAKSREKRLALYGVNKQEILNLISK
jgi:uncharacterized protein (TIGR00251 family)